MRRSAESRGRERLFRLVSHSSPAKYVCITEANNNVINSISKHSGEKYILYHFIIIINVGTDLIVSS